MSKAAKNFTRTKGLLPAISYCFCLTFMVFPGLVQDTNFNFLEGWAHEESWFVLSTLTLFNVWDTVGRMAANWKCMRLSRKTTLYL